MASTYSSLKFELIGTGDQAGTWGTTTNINLGTAIEEAITGSADVSFSSADVTLTLTNTNGAQTARNLRLNLVGTVGAAQNLIVPAIEKQYLINNTLGYAITVKNSTGSGITVPAGKSMVVFNTGSDVVDTTTHLSSLTLGSALPITSGGTGSTSTTYCSLTTNVTGTLPVANGGTGATTFTSGALLKGNTTGSIQTASAADIVAQIGTTAVTNATNATQITNVGGWSITPSGTNLYFNYNGTNVAVLDSTGNFTTLQNITAYGTV